MSRLIAGCWCLLDGGGSIVRAAYCEAGRPTLLWAADVGSWIHGSAKESRGWPVLWG